MELRQLTYVEAVARYGGFTRAAERLHVAQSAVSAQIKALEAELGLALFARTTRRVALTPAGELFVARARRVLAELDGARTEISEITAVVSGRVTVGATSALGPYDLVQALARFRDRFPGIVLRLRSGPITSLLGALDEGEIDLVVGPVYADLPARFDALPLTDEHLLLAMPLGHALARTGRLTLGEARDEPFVSLPPGTGLRWILEDAARSAGFTPKIHFETYDLAGIRSLVAAGLGVGLLSRHAAEHADGPAITTRNLHPTPVHPVIGVMHSRDRPLSPAAQSCRHHLVEMAARRPTAPPSTASTDSEATGNAAMEQARQAVADLANRIAADAAGRAASAGPAPAAGRDASAGRAVAGRAETEPVRRAGDNARRATDGARLPDPPPP